MMLEIPNDTPSWSRAISPYQWEDIAPKSHYHFILSFETKQVAFFTGALFNLYVRRL